MLYLKTADQRFTASMAFRDAAVRAAHASDLPAEVVQSIAQAKKYPEGRPARVEVSSAADLKVAATLLAIKLAN